MSEIITFPLPSGPNYAIPDVGDENWGQNVTDFLVAIPSGVMPTSGTFSLTGDVSFGPTFGLVSQYFKTATTVPATAGFLRLSKTDSIDWRNNANSADLALAINGSDQLTFAGTPITVGGVTSITGTANQIIASAATGAVTLSTPQSIAATSSPTFAGLTLSSPLTVANGGTGNSSFTAYSVICGGPTATGNLQNVSGVGLSGQFLQSQGAGLLPVWANAAGTGTVNSGTASHAAYYATSTNAVSDGGSAAVQIGSLLAVASAFQVAIQPNGSGNKINLSCTNPAADRTYTLPDRGANDTFAFLGGQAQNFAGATTFTSASGVTITPTSNQLILGTTRTVTLSAPTPASASRTYTLPDQGADYSVVATEGSQTINGAKTLTSALAMSSQKITGLADGTTGTDAINFSQVSGYQSSPFSNFSYAATGVFNDAASITLAAGTWDITFHVESLINGATWSTVSSAVTTTPGNSAVGIVQGTNTSGGSWASSATTPTGLSTDICNYRVTHGGSTTYYGKLISTYSAGGPPKANGILSAKRVY